MRASGTAERISVTCAAPRARSTITTSAAGSRPKTTPGMAAPIRDRAMRSVVVAATSNGSDAEARLGDRELRPALARLLGEFVHQCDRVGIVVAGPDLDRAVGEHAFHQLTAGVGANDREG